MCKVESVHLSGTIFHSCLEDGQTGSWTSQYLDVVALVTAVKNL